MLYLRMAEAKSSDSPERKLIHVYPTPPSLDDPQCLKELYYDLVIVDIQAELFTNDIWERWKPLKDQKAHWNNIDWTITYIQPVENGDSCFLLLEWLDEKTQRLPISGEEKTKDESH
jgi:hypothetical protein